MYNDDYADDWRGLFRLRIPPARWLYAAAAMIVAWKLGALIASMKRRLETLEAILLDQPRR